MIGAIIQLSRGGRQIQCAVRVNSLGCWRMVAPWISTAIPISWSSKWYLKKALSLIDNKFLAIDFDSFADLYWHGFGRCVCVVGV